MKITIAYPIHPAEEHPNEWTTQEIHVTDAIAWIEPFSWGNKTGCKVFFLKKEAPAWHTYWHFVISRFSPTDLL